MLKRRRGLVRMGLAALIGVLLTTGLTVDTAAAETVRGDLKGRFDGDVKITYEDIEYRQRKRMTTALFLGIAPDENGESYRPEMLILLAIDDGRKLVVPLRLDCGLLEIQEGEAEADESCLEYAVDPDDIKAGCEGILRAVNGLLPAEVIEHYIALDLRGLSVIDGLDSEDYENRLRAVKRQVETMPSGALNDLFGEMSDYIVTDMKSGALMKIIDKADRYERTAMIDVMLEENWNQEDADSILFSEEAFLKLAVDIFFEENTLW